jgi:hypothetical protein
MPRVSWRDANEARIAVRVSRDIHGIALPDPILVPLQVGSFGAQTVGGEEAEIVAMTATIDVDALPGLRAAFEKHASGTALDIVSQWHTAVPADTQVAPLAFLLLDISEFDLRFNIVFDLDEHRRSLAAAARTGMLMLFEPRLGEALRLEAPQQALQRLQSLGLVIGDAEPLRRALQQRFDLPFPTRPVPRIEVAAANVASALDEFRECARVGAELAVVNPISSWPIVVVVDPDANQNALAGSVPEDRWAHWSAVVAGPHALIRLDLVERQTPLAAWVWADPPQELVRATSSGPHHIAVVSAAIPDAPQERKLQLEAAPMFPVKEAPPAMRGLLR